MRSFVFSFLVVFLWVLPNYSAHGQTVVDSLLGVSKQQQGPMLVKTLNELSWEYKSIDTKEAKKYALSAVELSNSLDNDTLLAASYNSLANVYEARGVLDSALVYHQSSLALKEQYSDSLGLADSYNNLGIINDQLANYQQALKLYFDALRIYERESTDFTQVPMVLSNIGIVYKKQGAFNKTIDFYSQALAIYEQNNYQIGIAITKGNMGALAIKTGDFNKTLDYSQDAMTLYSELGYQRYVPYMQVNMAVAHDSLKNLNAAETLYELAISGFESDNNLYELCNARISYSSALFLQHKDSKALEQMLSGLALAEQNNFKEFEQRAVANLAVMYANQTQEYAKAYTYSQRAHELYKEMFEEEKTKSIFELEAKYQSQKKENEILAQRAELAEASLENKKKTTLFYGAIGLAIVLAILGYLVYTQQRLKNKQLQKEAQLTTALAKIETQNQLQEQRLRISRDLHDNIGAQLTFIISSLDNIKYGFKDIKKDLSTKLSGISSFTGQTIYELRDTIWAMNKDQIYFDDLKARITNFMESAKTASSAISFAFNVDASIAEDYAFSSVAGMNMYRIIQESVNNSLKYANATHISVSINQDQDCFKINVEDNGTGFDMQSVQQGNGLNNIRKRAGELQADVQFITTQDAGTSVRLTMPKNSES